MTATDPDLPAQGLTFSLRSGGPAGLVLSPDGAFTWIPGEAQGPANHPVRVSVTDGVAMVQRQFTVTVQEPDTGGGGGEPIEPPKPRIVWVSSHPAESAPSPEAVAAGFTSAPDARYTQVLTARGYSVTRHLPTAEPDVPALNRADLVVLSRSLPVAPFRDAAATRWNSITASTMILGGHMAGNEALGFLGGPTIAHTVGPVRLNVTAPGHPVFRGVSLLGNGETMNPVAEQVRIGGVLQRGIAVGMDSIAALGSLLAGIGNAADPAFGGTAIGEWRRGAIMANAGNDFLGGHRLLFMTGSTEQGLPPEAAGVFDLTGDGTRLFLNAVEYLIGLGGSPSVMASGAVPAGLGGIPLTGIEIDADNRIITATIPEGGSHGYLTISPPVVIRRITVEGDRLKIEFD